MNKIVKAIVWLVVLVAIAVAGLLSYVKFALPNVGEPEDLQIDYSQERVDRGKYLAHSVMLCIDCHSERDYSKFAAPPVSGSFGKGGELFGKKMGFSPVVLNFRFLITRCCVQPILRPIKKQVSAIGLRSNF